MLKLLLHKKVHFTALGSAKLITSVTNYMERAYRAHHIKRQSLQNESGTTERRKLGQ